MFISSKIDTALNYKCMYIYMYIYICIYMCVCACGGQNYLLLTMDMAKSGWSTIGCEGLYFHGM